MASPFDGNLLEEIMSIQFIPLNDRVCFDLMVNGILGPEGKHPMCMGNICSKYEKCLFEVFANAESFNELKDAEDAKEK
jgi:hypothetical protein